MPKNSKNAGVLLFVLCSNKEQQKDCVVRDLNLFRANDASGNNAYENLKSGRIVRRKTNKCKKLLLNKIISFKKHLTNFSCCAILMAEGGV